MSDTEIQLQMEALKARLMIRDFVMRTVVQEVYENIAQVLSLVRYRLSSIVYGTPCSLVDEILASGSLVGQSIQDLRAVCRDLNPETVLFRTNGLIQSLSHTLDFLQPGKVSAIEVKGDITGISSNEEIIYFCILQEILISLYDHKSRILGISIEFSERSSRAVIEYALNHQNAAHSKSDPRKTPAISILHERLQLIRGVFSEDVLPSGNKKISLSVHFNTWKNE